MKKTTAMDVAKATGFSRACVYAALKNHPGTNPKTAELIQKKAKEMGFSPDPIFSEMGHRRWKESSDHFGANIIFFTGEATLIANQKALDHLKAYAQSKSYALTFCDPVQFKSIEQANREFYSKGVRGIIVSSLEELGAGKFISDLDTDHIAVVAGEMNHHLFHSVSWNWSAMVSDSIQALVDRGYQNISILLYRNKPLRFYDKERLGTVYTAKEEESIQINLHTTDTPWGESASDSPTLAAEHRQRRLHMVEQDQPDAVIGWSSEDYWEFRNAGYHIPEDFGYVALVSEGSCSGMEIDRFEVWKVELDRVIELIRNQDFGYPENPIISLYTPKFIDRGTA